MQIPRPRPPKMSSLEMAYLIWFLRHYRHHEINKAAEAFLTSKLKNSKEGPAWLKKSREALFLSSGTVAEKMSITRQAYLKLEKNEELGAISLNTLASAAEALDCELVYGLRPKNKKSFAQNIWQKLSKQAMTKSRNANLPQQAKANSIASILSDRMQSSEFRKQQQWSERV